MDYIPVNAPNPAALNVVLRGMGLNEAPPTSAGPRRGQPLSQYNRAYLLLPPRRGSDWAIAAARATWPRHRLTIGGSADDAGVGTLNARHVIAVNPSEWGGGNLQDWYNLHYPRVSYQEVVVRSASQLSLTLTQLFP